MPKMPDLTKFSVEELKALQKDLEKALAKAEKKKLDDARAAAEAAAKAAGFTLAELVGEPKKSKGGTKAANPPKYRHPENDALTWSGRGRQPAWFKEAIEAGTPEDALLITV